MGEDGVAGMGWKGWKGGNGMAWMEMAWDAMAWGGMALDGMDRWEWVEEKSWQGRDGQDGGE